MSILRLKCMTFLVSNVFGVWMVLKYFGASLQAIRPDMTHITSCKNVISIKDTANAVFVAFWLVLPLRERKNFIRFS